MSNLQEISSKLWAMTHELRGNNHPGLHVVGDAVEPHVAEGWEDVPAHGLVVTSEGGLGAGRSPVAGSVAKKPPVEV